MGRRMRTDVTVVDVFRHQVENVGYIPTLHSFEVGILAGFDELLFGRHDVRQKSFRAVLV